MYNKSEHLKARVKNSVDVSGSFDNCFFHNYALYLLTNHLPLPDNLFNFESVLEQNSKAEKLFHFFPDQDSLNQFFLSDPSESQAHYLFEKTLILGFLFREWFPTHLMKYPDVANALLEGEKGVLTGFNNYIAFREFMSKEELSTSEFSVLYEANQDFLEYFYNRSHGGLDLNSPFEEYFAQASSPEEAIKNYWNIEGYSSYCKFMAQPDVKLSPIDIKTMMMVIEQPFTIYEYSTAIVVDEYSNLNGDIPKFEVALHPSQGHYFLLKNDKTKADLKEYEKSHQQYKTDREQLLAHSGQPVSSLLVRATCPKGHLDAVPFDALIASLSDQVTHKLIAENEDEKPVNALIESPPHQASKESTVVNCNFLLNIGASMLGTSAALVTLIGIGMITGQYDLGVSLVEEAVAISVISSVAGLGTASYGFFKSAPKPTAQTELEDDLSATVGKQKSD